MRNGVAPSAWIMRLALRLRKSPERWPAFILGELSGRQWCEDSYDAAGDSRVLRGGSWDDIIDIQDQLLLSSYRGHVSFIGRFAGILPPGELGSVADNIGFRCVVATDGSP
jgi:formylglycine-generating enzyme required for sulfatase activity